MNEQWSDKSPTEEGVYWFYGWASDFEFRWNNYSDPPEQIIVRASRIGNGKIMLEARGEFLSKGDMRGKWLRIEVPAPPYINRADYE